MFKNWATKPWRKEAGIWPRARIPHPTLRWEGEVVRADDLAVQTLHSKKQEWGRTEADWEAALHRSMRGCYPHEKPPFLGGQWVRVQTANSETEGKQPDRQSGLRAKPKTNGSRNQEKKQTFRFWRPRQPDPHLVADGAEMPLWKKAVA